MKKLNKKNVTELLINIQNNGNPTSNAIATKAISDFGLTKVHKKLTESPTPHREDGTTTPHPFSAPSPLDLL